MQQDDRAPEVTIASGRLSGRLVDGVASFLGVPYATTTLFGMPQPVPAWDGTRAATELGPTAPQPPYEPPYDKILSNPMIPGDDFLNVNVWTPGGSDLPVMVWLPGGAYRNGSNASPVYDGSAFARDGVVVVSINYRLGAPGFAVVPDAPHNRGLRDQLAALTWVRQNVAAFGGDPEQVTVFGESAGAMSVATLMAAPAARSLFRRAIVQSGNGTAVADPGEAAVLTKALADILGTEPTAAAFEAAGGQAVIEAQRQVAMEIRTRPDPRRWGATVIAAGMGIMSFTPVIDGELVPRRPIDAIGDGVADDIDLLAGSTSEEFRLFTGPTGVIKGMPAEMLPTAASVLGADEQMIAAYAEARPGALPGEIYTALITDRAFRVPAIKLAEGKGGTSFLYEFAWPSNTPGFGACHALELPFVFDTLGSADPLTGPEPPQPLADEVHAAWVAFAKNGDPGWPAYTIESRRVMTFDHPDSSLVEDPRGAERLLWDGRL